MEERKPDEQVTVRPGNAFNSCTCPGVGSHSYGLVFDDCPVHGDAAPAKVTDKLHVVIHSEPPEDERVMAEMPPEEASADEHGLTAEVHLSAMPPSAPHVYTLPEKLSLAINDAIGQKPEYSGRYCTLCGETTAHFRPRGKGPDYVKSMQWCCAPCFMPGGAVYEIVKSLMTRQGDILK